MVSEARMNLSHGVDVINLVSVILICLSFEREQVKDDARLD